jgi:hypothetical protein
MSAARLRFALVIVPVLISAAPPAKEPGLSAEDKKYLDGLLKDFLFDPPKDAERVGVKVTVRTVWGGAGEATRAGWHVPGENGKPGRVFFTDGGSIAAPPAKQMKNIDFVAVCRERYAQRAAPKKDAGDDPDFDEVFGQMRRTAVGSVGDGDLALAAWLYRRGEERLAARALAAGRGSEADLRADLAWSAFAGLVHAFMARADDEALAHGERLLKLYAKQVEAKEGGYPQAKQIVEDLKRRKKEGTFGKEPPEKWPDGFDKWDAKKKVAHLIAALEDVDARQDGQPGGIDLESDRRVEELIRVGDAAVPALIDVLEKDERLTRSVHFWRDFARQRTVMGVREAAVTALMAILRKPLFVPASTGDNFTARNKAIRQKIVKDLRAYWKEYGKLPFDERMMKILTDAKTSFAAKREAADNLATLPEDRRFRTTMAPVVIGGGQRKPNPAVKKFSKPTVAEAILAAMDAELTAFEANKGEGSRESIEGAYLGPLIDLDDRRVAPELAKRAAAAKTLRGRVQWAYAARALGESKPFTAFANDFRGGKVKFAAGEAGERELRNVVRALIEVGGADCDRALNALADPKHPQHEQVVKRVLEERNGFRDGPWLAHPFCLRVLRVALDDRTPTGGIYEIKQDKLVFDNKGWGHSGGVPDFLADKATRREKAQERVCDVAAETLNVVAAGLPLTHPLMKDADKRIDQMKQALDRPAGFRWASEHAAYALRMVPRGGFVPDVNPLDRAATADDVKAGKAIFHLDGKGKLADVKLPAVGVLKGEEKKDRPTRVVIVQAEVGPDEKVTYGVILRHEIRSMPASEVKDVKSFEQLDKEDKEAAEKAKKEAEKDMKE